MTLWFVRLGLGISTSRDGKVPTVNLPAKVIASGSVNGPVVAKSRDMEMIPRLMSAAKLILLTDSCAVIATYNPNN